MKTRHCSAGLFAAIAAWALLCGAAEGSGLDSTTLRHQCLSRIMSYAQFANSIGGSVARLLP